MVSSTDESTISRALYTAHMPDPDLIIRGLLRAAHIQLPPLANRFLWPDFRGIHLLEALSDYQRR